MLKATIAFGLLCQSTLAAMCHGGDPQPGPPNTLPVDDSEPVFVKQVPNGKLYKIGSNTNISNELDIVHVYGSPYEMGFAHGALLKDKLQAFIPELFQYLETQVFVNASTNPLEAYVARIGMDVALDLSYARTEKYINPNVMQELYGLSNGSGIALADVRRLQWIGELTRGSCSMFGAWGSATMESRQGKLLQLRALDWDTDGPFKDFATLVVYHPSGDAGTFGHALANLGFAGWIASVTGMSSSPLALSEIGVSYPDAGFGKETYLAEGYPFGFVIRDVLQYDDTLTDAINRITGAKRTCDLILGVGDGANNAFRGFRYSPDQAYVVDDTNLIPEEDWHPKIPNVVYWGMDWICPNDNKLLSDRLLALHGNISAANTMQDILPYVQTGNLHIAVYDMDAMTMHVATAAHSDYTGSLKNAYQRQYVKLDMAKLFAEPAPTTGEVLQ